MSLQRSSVSVVMPTYNGERYLRSALASVRADCAEQPDCVEVVVVDDGSSDGTLQIVQEFARDLRIKLVAPGRVGNWMSMSNIGLREASADWACFLHQDDVWLPGRLARVQRELDHGECALVLHNSMFIGPDGGNLGPWTCPLPEAAISSERFIERLLVQNFIAMPSVTFQRKIALEAGGLDETLWYAADWDLWLRLGCLGSVRFIPETLSGFRIHPQSQTASRRASPHELERQLMIVLDRHLPRLRGAATRRAHIKRLAMASIAVNSALSDVFRGERVVSTSLFLRLLGLGPVGWFRYARYSRILERVRSRLKVLNTAQAPGC